ncbi:MAG: T9SS C-terminal target domain-containing protein [Bacteroidetes bacterium]|nr:MAG: T9SS C-terminal target domain-containing protein [Bacteroidota bacterium]
MKKTTIFFLFLCFICVQSSFAQGLSANFSTGIGFNASTHPIAIQTDGKILVGGSFTSYNGTNVGRIVRLNANGTIDNTFNTGGAGFSNNVVAVAIQPDGKIIVGGAFGDYNGTPVTRIARLNSNGTLDNTFTVGTGASDFISNIHILPDNKILISGAFTSIQGVQRNRIARLQSNGNLDTSFNPGTGFDNYTPIIQPLSDGKILAGGQFTTFNGVTRNRIARLNADGSLDTSFNPGTGADNTVYGVGVQSDGKIIIGGFFNTVNGTTRSKLARLNTDGSLDTSFPCAGCTGFTGNVSTVYIMNNDRILVVGQFTAYNGISQNRVILLESGGQTASGYNFGTGFNDFLNVGVSLGNNKWLFSGGFTTYSGTTASRLAMLDITSSCPFSIISPSSFPAGTFNTVYPSQTLAQTSLVGTITWSITSGSLPNGLTLGSSTGTISGTPTSVGPFNFTVQASNGTCTQSKSYSITINKANQTITFNALTARTFGDAPFTLSATASSGLAVSYTSSNTNVATISGNTVTIVGAGTANITASQAGNTNYNPATNVVQALTVNKANQTITFNIFPNKTFGDAPFALSATASSGLAVSYTSSNTSVATISGNTVTIVGAGTSTITASQAGNTNYNPANNVAYFWTVNKANQSITFNALPAKTFGDAPFTLSATASSGLAVSYTSSNTSVATISGNTVTIVGAGTTNITASQAGNTNYNPANNAVQALTVNKANQTITFNALPAKTFGDAPFTLSATASSGLAVSYTSSNTSVATISGNTVTIVGAGTTNITASQAGNTNYNPATNVVQALQVSPPTRVQPTLTITPVLVYPNPNQSGIFIVDGLQEVDKQQVSFAVVDMGGKEIAKGVWNNTNKTILRLDKAPKGVYTLVLQGKTAQSVTKIVIE